MRRTHVFLALAVSCLAFLTATEGFAQQAIRWEPILENGQRLAAQNNRLVLIHFWSTSCVYCRKMEADVYNQPAVAAEIAANYVPVKLNADSFPATARQYGVTSLPTTVITTPQGQPVDVIRGYVEVNQYVARIRQVAANVRSRNAMYAQIPAGNAPAANGMQPYAAQPMTAQAMPQQAAQTPVMPAQTAAAPANNSAVQPSDAAASPVMSNTFGNDRYASYFPQNANAAAAGAAAPTTPTNNNATSPLAAAGSVPTATAPVTNGAPAGYGPLGTPAANPQPAAMTPAQQPVAAGMASGAVAAAPAASYAAQTPQQAAAAAPPMQQPLNVAARAPFVPQNAAAPPAGEWPLCLDGFCPVALCERQQWVLGDKRWGIRHRGRTYLFSGEAEQKRFLANPDRYAAVNSGNDLVLAMEQGQAVPGTRKHGVYYNAHVYLFASESSLEKFSRNPNVYANYASEALRASGTVNR